MTLGPNTYLKYIKLFTLSLVLGANAVFAGLPPIKSTGQTYITTTPPSTVNANAINLSGTHVTSTLPLTKGGLYPLGSEGTILKISSGAPAWSAAGSNFSVTSITANPSPAVSGVTYLADTSSAGFSVTLPTPVLNAYVIIKDKKGTFQTNNLTILQSGSEKIEGVAASKVYQTNWGSVTLVSDGTDWWIL